MERAEHVILGQAPVIDPKLDADFHQLMQVG